MMIKKTAVLCLLFIFGIPQTVFAVVPNDPFVEQWAYTMVNAYDAWDITTGSSDVVVAVIDNGFDHFHPDLRDNVWVNTDEIPNNNIDDDKNGYIDDVYGWDFSGQDKNGDGIIDGGELQGDNNPRPDPTEDTESLTIHHGSVVAGIIGAVGNNGKDGAGIAWNVKLMNLKVVTNGGYGSLGRLDRAIEYAVDNGADIINMSLVTDTSYDGLSDAIQYAYDHDVVIVAAAGNEASSLNISPLYPACSDRDISARILGVNAILQDRRLAPFSNYGADCLDMTAPGVDLGGPLRYSPNNGLDARFSFGWNGTSFASPLVAGAAALVRSLQPSWSADQVMDAILNNTSKTPPDDEKLYKEVYGAGLLDLFKVVQYASNGKTTDSTSVPENPVLINNRIAAGILGVAQNGQLATWDTQTNKQTVSQIDVLKDVRAVTSYKEKGENKYAVSLYQDGTSVIVFFDEQWSFLNFWTVTSDGPLDIAAANVVGSESAEILLAPIGPSTELAAVYSSHGVLLSQSTLPSSHQGVAVAASEGRFYAVYADSAGLALHALDPQGRSTDRYPVTFPAHRANLAVGDIDQDGADEFVLGAPEGVLPYVAFYEFDGSLISFFFAESLALTHGVDIAVSGSAIATAPQGGEYPVRLWTTTGENIAQWQPFGDGYQNGILLLPQ